MGLASRVTFYIGTDGRVLYVDREISTKSAGRDMLARLAALGVKRRP